MSYHPGERLYIAQDFYQNVEQCFDINNENKTATLKQLDPKIDWLSIYYCGADFDVEHVIICNQPSLRYLSIHGLFCHTCTLRIANLPNLTRLECENVYVEKILIENASLLEEVIIKGDGKCISLAIMGCPTLEYLNCSCNRKLEYLVIEPHNSLRQLNYSNNDIRGNFDLTDDFQLHQHLVKYCWN